MTRVALVACSKTKANDARPAAALYTSPLFRKSLLLGLSGAEKVYILSAKHGLVDLSAPLSPYDQTLKKISRADRETWGKLVGSQLCNKLQPGDVVQLLCGEEYATPVRPILKSMYCSVEYPLIGLSLGARLKQLRESNDETVLKAQFRKFDHLMRQLWRGQQGGRKISECTGRLEWPNRGVYFILGVSEGRRMPRIVRVGTHAVSKGAQTKLWNRLSTHRGTSEGGGSHRSSIFRQHVGRALIKERSLEEQFTTWSVGQSAPRSVRSKESDLELEVSRFIGEHRVIWVSVPDLPSATSDRAYIERNAIGLLSRIGLLTPSSHSSWLGEYSPDWRIAASGLWNLDHLFAVPDPDFINILNTYIEGTLGICELPEGSIAPKRMKASSVSQIQLGLFQ